MFDKNTSITEGQTYTNTGGTTALVNSFIQESYIPVLSSTAYTMSTTNNYSSTTDYRLVICEYDANKNFIQRTLYSSSNKFTLTTTANTKFIRLCASTVTINELQLELGSTATEYEPYGKVWYKKKYIEKLVLDGSETNWYNLNLTFYLEGTYPQTLNALCSHFTKQPNAQWTSSDTTYRGKFTMANIANQIKFMHTDENITTVAQWKTWLSSNNVTLYYVLNTPTYTIITEQALIDQLEAIKYSMNGTTIITQTNEDKPFELDVKALTDISQLTVLTQAEYNALTPDSNTIYIVRG